MIDYLKDTLGELDVIKTSVVSAGGGVTVSIWHTATGLIIGFFTIIFVIFRAVSAGLKAKKDALELQITIDKIEERKNKRDSNDNRT